MMIDQRRIAIAKDSGLGYARAIAIGCEQLKVPYPVGCALIEQESGGSNVYGHDQGGALFGFPFPVDQGNWQVFWWLVKTKGQRSNGVGPAQITDRGLLEEMDQRGLHPWVPVDNIYFGLEVLKGWHDRLGVGWRVAAGHYNGGTTPDMTYAGEFHAKRLAWRALFA